MTIISIVLILLVAGLVVYALNLLLALLPIDAKFRTLINVVIVLVAIIWTLQVLGVKTGFEHIRFK